MAFTIRDLSVLAYARGFTLWHYKAGTATLAEVDGAGFFNDAADMMPPGDIIMVSAADGGAQFYVASVAEGVVTIASMARTVAATER